MSKLKLGRSSPQSGAVILEEPEAMAAHSVLLTSSPPSRLIRSNSGTYVAVTSPLPPSQPGQPSVSGLSLEAQVAPEPLNVSIQTVPNVPTSPRPVPSPEFERGEQYTDL
jgi:hypothetical protein